MDDTSMDDEEVLRAVALVWMHLPSGAAALQGVVRAPDGGPIVAGSALRRRPVAAGGGEVLFPGRDPDTVTWSPDTEHWHATTPDLAHAAAVGRGWTPVSRAAAARLMRAQGYVMRESGQPGHVLHLDHADDRVWHPRVGADGKPNRYVAAAFITRPLAWCDALTTPPSSLTA